MDRCPTCGSDMPERKIPLGERRKYIEGWPDECPDPFHTPEPVEGRCGGSGRLIRPLIGGEPPHQLRSISGAEQYESKPCGGCPDCDPPPSSSDTKGRSIVLGEPNPDWAVAYDQEGEPWITCHGIAVLNLNGALRRATLAQLHATEVERDAARAERDLARAALSATPAEAHGEILRQRARATQALSDSEHLREQLDQIKLAVQECDTAAEKLDHPSEDRIVQYRLNTGPWHRLLALTGPGPHDKSPGDLWQERARDAESQSEHLRERLGEARDALERIEAENRKRAWLLPRFLRDVALAKWTADLARDAVSELRATLSEEKTDG